MRRDDTPVLSRFVLLPSGEAYARFADSSLVQLNAPAAAYAILAPDGSKTSGLSSCATAANRPYAHGEDLQPLPFAHWEGIQRAPPRAVLASFCVPSMA